MQSDSLDVVVLSGLSGSGKSTALHALEDAGFFCVDNLPTALVGTFLRLAEDHPALSHVALAVDVRERPLTDGLAPELLALSVRGAARFLFLDCDEAQLIRRFKTTRRRHPVIAQGAAQTIAEAIALERSWLQPIRALATLTVDTTGMTVHDLKRQIVARFGEAQARTPTLYLQSFGFRHGLPPEADFVFDARFLDNPYFVEALRTGTGLDPEVADYVMSQPAAQRLVDHIVALLQDVLPLIDEEGRAAVTAAIGCTGGHHRSVALVERVRERLGTGSRPLHVTHRDVER